MKEVISKPHPNGVGYIQREEAVTKDKIQSFRSGATVPPRRRRQSQRPRFRVLGLALQFLHADGE